MKTIITFILVGLMGLSMTSCSFTTGSGSIVENSTQTTDYVTAGAMVATIAIIDAAKSDSDKEKKKEIIGKILSFVKLADDGKITAQELEAVITSEVEIKQHWKIYITTLTNHIKAHVNVPKHEIVTALVTGIEAGLNYE